VARAEYGSAIVLTPGRSFRVERLDDCRYVAVSPDGEWLATGSHQGGAQVWRMADAARVADLPTDTPTGVFFSPDGKWLMTTQSPCSLWSVGTWREARRIGGLGFGFSPDGRLAVVSDADRSIRLVEAESGRTVARLESPDSCGVTWAAFSPDGSRLVVTTNDGPAAHVWDLRAIRRHLRGMELDWDAPPLSEDDPAGPDAPPLPPLRVDFGPPHWDIERGEDIPEALVRRYTARLAIQPDDVEAHHRRGHALARLSRPDEAIADFTAAIRLRPDDDHLRSARAWLYESRDRYEPAIDDLEAAIALRPDDPHTRESLARCCNGRAWEVARDPAPRRDVARALVLSRRSLDLDPPEVFWYLNTMGVVQYRAGLHAEAIATLDKSLAAGRGRLDGFDLVFQAMAHHRLGHRDVARGCFDRAVRWQREHTGLEARQIRELSAFRAEAEAVLAGPAGELPDDVFAPLRRGGD
jgi:hypothetical protein